MLVLEGWGKKHDFVGKYRPLLRLEGNDPACNNLYVKWKIVLIGFSDGAEDIKNDVTLFDKNDGEVYTLAKKKFKDCREMLIEAAINIFDEDSSDSSEGYEATPYGQLVWSAKESHHLQHLAKSSNAEMNEDDSFVLLDLNGTYTCAKKSVLFKESAYFQAR